MLQNSENGPKISQIWKKLYENKSRFQAPPAVFSGVRRLRGGRLDAVVQRVSPVAGDGFHMLIDLMISELGFQSKIDSILMVKVVKTYKVQFVINISEHGEYDPLLKNASWQPELQKIPWYTTVTTKASKGQGKNYFVDRIRMPYGQTLDIIALDTKLVQNPSSVPGKDQLQWLTRTLNNSDVDWKLVIGFHHLFTYDYNMQKIKEQETTSRPLLSTLLRYGVDAYMSSLIHADHVQRDTTQLTNIGPTDKSPYFISLNQNTVPIEETVNGFLLHSVTSLEMVTFFVTLTGEIENRVSFRQRGRAVM